MHLGIPDPPLLAGMRWRHRYCIVGVVLCLILIGWGGVVTSMDAGLAVPDWPTSFGSYDPFATGFSDPANPGSRWWHHAPILAEHGHRLLGALVGLWAVFLVIWTWRADPRRWLRLLTAAALGLVVLQGVLGGLRVIRVSLDLALVHALAAQLFFCLLVAISLCTSRSWTRGQSALPHSSAARALQLLSLATAALLYVQILLGALLRHYGEGIRLDLSVVHILGAAAVMVLILATARRIRGDFATNRLLNAASWFMIAAAGLQIMLGFIAFAVLQMEAQLVRRSTAQILLNSAHLVTGTILMGNAVSVVLLALRTVPKTSTQ